MISVEETAGTLGVSTKTVRRMISRGVLEARRIGPRLLRVPVAGLAQTGRQVGNWSPSS
ncbi:DNA binding domain-containing protein, excisionase family [Microbacterium sp. RURRCA19A]|nr:DNA binding domain-containing protein, excisionase family [Microbacterium sp. RURRCA19A]